MLARKALAGTAGAPKEYVEDVFQTWLYTGTNDTQTIANGIDVSGDGGLVWIKSRSTTWDHCLFDTARGGVGKAIFSNSTAAEATGYTTTFLSNGFSVGNANAVNQSDQTYASWTFRKAKKFFDVVTYTGNGSAPRNISHNLDSSPGFIAIKRTDSTGDWWCWHRSIANKNIYLNYTDAADSGANPMISAVSSTNFTLATNQNATMNINGATYVAYLFAHDAGGFGDAGSDSIIKCGSLTTDGSGDATVTLDWEPQWLLLKPSSTTGNWLMVDTMRGWNVQSSGNIQRLFSNLSNAESAGGQLNPTATGFKTSSGGLSASTTYIYIAIRRGPMKTPTSGTSVYAGVTANAASTPVLVTFNTVIESGDLGFATNLNNANRAYGGTAVFDRLRGANYLFTNATDAEGAASGQGFIDQKSYVRAFGSGDVVGHFFRRAPGFFDVVCYTGNGSTNTISHNLGVAPELVFIKGRSSAYGWQADALFTSTQHTHGNLNAPDALYAQNYGASVYNAQPTSSSFQLTSTSNWNNSGTTFVAYLFASVSGVSKVGSYTGNGSSVTVTTGFQPRFILVKRTDSTGNWIVSDSARGLVAGNDPYLLLNSTAAEDTDEDWVDVSSTGFTVNETSAANANVNTGTYIYLAIA